MRDVTSPTCTDCGTGMPVLRSVRMSVCRPGGVARIGTEKCSEVDSRCGVVNTSPN